MVENFGGSILYLILFLVQLLGLSFYSYLVILNPKKIIADYQVGEGAIAPKTNRLFHCPPSFSWDLFTFYFN